VCDRNHSGDVFKRARPYTFVHATFYRLTSGAEAVGVSNRTAKAYFERVLNTPWHEWTGVTVRLRPRYATPIADYDDNDVI
jgi:hypothetical protein